MNLLNANGELVPDEPKVVVLLNPDREVAQFATSVSNKLTVIITTDPKKFKEEAIGLPFHTPPLSSLQPRKHPNN